MRDAVQILSFVHNDGIVAYAALCGRRIAPRTAGKRDLAILKQLIAPEAYVASEWDLLADAAGRESWVEYFRRHLDTLLAELRRSYPDAPEQRVAALRDDYLRRFDEVARRPERFERLDVLTLDRIVSSVLDEYGFADPFAALKFDTTAAALRHYSRLCARLDELEPAPQLETLVRGLLAGNLFDVGAPDAVRRHAEHKASFERTRASLAPRPWRFDDADEFIESVAARRHEHVAFFVDNAGGDTVLGALPVVRWLLRAECRVTLCANSAPALNDVTARELAALLDRAPIRDDDVLARARNAGRLRVVASGSTTPLLDLTALSDECVSAVADADLVMLHGMGRSVESNWNVALSCAHTHSAMLKDRRVAARLGAELFDCVFRYAPARAESAAAASRKRG
ncbi:MAG: DUF89 family protein [Planctomycetota bacterium]|nr:MAG: DUF89 family protein [Planctomycetota bacterium]